MHNVDRRNPSLRSDERDGNRSGTNSRSSRASGVDCPVSSGDARWCQLETRGDIVDGVRSDGRRGTAWSACCAEQPPPGTRLGVRSGQRRDGNQRGTLFNTPGSQPAWPPQQSRHRSRHRVVARDLTLPYRVCLERSAVRYGGAMILHRPWQSTTEPDRLRMPVQAGHAWRRADIHGASLRRGSSETRPSDHYSPVHEPHSGDGR